MGCIPCESSETKKKHKNLERTKEKAQEWAKARQFNGFLVIVELKNGYGFRQTDCSCLTGPDALTEVERIYFDKGIAA